MPIVERRVLVDQIDIFRDGLVGVRMKKLAMLSDGRVRWAYHRASITPQEDAEERIAAVSEHLAAMRVGDFARADRERVLRTCARVHHKETAEAFAERIAKLEAGEDLDGAIVFSQTSIFRKTPGCPAGRIDALILARPVEIIAGFEPQPVTAGDGASLFRLFPGADVAAERAAFESNLAADRLPDEAQWSALADTAGAEHTPEVVARFAAELPTLVERGVLARAVADGRERSGKHPQGFVG